MADELVDALEKMKVGLGLDVERRGPEGRRVQPCPCLGRDDRTIVEMADRRGPPRCPQRLPLRAFPFWQIDARVARDRRWRHAVALDAESGTVLPGPCLHRRQEALVDEFGQRLAPVVAERRAGRPRIEDEGGQERAQVVAPPHPERVEEVARPVGLECFEAVAEHRVRRGRLESLQQAIADSVQVVVERRAIVVVEDESFGADGGTLHHHAGAAADEEQRLPFLAGAIGQSEHAVGDIGDFPQAVGRCGCG